MNKYLMLVFTCFIALLSCNAPKNGTTSSPTKPTNPTNETPTQPTANDEPMPAMSVNFINNDDFTAAMKKAKTEKKVLFVDFYTTWCAPCRVMEQSVFKDELVAEYMNTNCISLRVNAEKGKGPQLKLENAVDAYPTMLVFNSNGDEIARKQGSLGIEAFKTFIKSAVWKAKNP